MSKAKELAREMLDEATDMRYKGHATIKLFDKVEELIDAVLSEPELRGWIEVGEKPARKLINLNTGKIFEETKDNRVLFENCREDGYERMKISFDDFKQLIKEAS